MTSSMLQSKYHSYIDQKLKWLGMEKSPLTSLFDLHTWKLSSREDTARARPQLETEWQNNASLWICFFMLAWATYTILDPQHLPRPFLQVLELEIYLEKKNG